ncbi:MAG: hypothetical protein K2X47_10670 [Bdellovibrionales bacterium]|nr:hypothetical protein [Bdellovibrionales bacterium]
MGKRRNPLFVDSTKFTGDLVSMQIEIKARTVFLESQLRMEIFKRGDVPTQVTLVRSSSSSAAAAEAAASGVFYWAGQIQLEHLEPFSYQLVLSSSEQLDIRGPKKEGLGGYILLDEWSDPLLVAPEPPIECPMLALPPGELLKKLADDISNF